MQDLATKSTANVTPGTAAREGHDEIEASKAPLMEHLIELRQRLIQSLIAFGIMFVG